MSAKKLRSILKKAGIEAAVLYNRNKGFVRHDSLCFYEIIFSDGNEIFAVDFEDARLQIHDHINNRCANCKGFFMDFQLIDTPEGRMCKLCTCF